MISLVGRGFMSFFRGLRGTTSGSAEVPAYDTMMENRWMLPSRLRCPAARGAMPPEPRR